MRRAKALSLAALVVLTVTCWPVNGQQAADAAAPVVNRARVYLAPGQAERVVGGRVVASNSGETVGFVELAKIDAAPAEGQWIELRFDNRTPYRWVKYEGPDDSHGLVAEVEFYAGERRLTGKPFGVAGTREKGRSFDKALDGDTGTWFDAFLTSGAYVGLDLGTEANTAPTPLMSPAPGRYDEPVRLTISVGAPGGEIRYTTDGSIPTPTTGQVFREAVALERGVTPVSAIALAAGKFPGEPVSGVYTIGDVPPPGGLVTFSTGNSLSDTFNGWLEPVARSAGCDHRAYRFSVPGAPTDWLWNHPGAGFGRPDYARAFVELAPMDVLITQPFAGHGRSIENETEYSGNFYMMARESSPNIQLYLYQQWPGRDFKDSWAAIRHDYMKAIAEERGLTPATTWEQGVVNHLAYFDALRDTMDREYPGKPVLIVPTGLALVNLKKALEAGEVPGLPEDQFFELHYASGDKGPGWNIHMIDKGRYFVSLVLYCCFYREAPGKVNLPQETTTLTPGQDAVYKRIAWETVRDYPWAGVKPLPGSE